MLIWFRGGARFLRWLFVRAKCLSSGVTTMGPGRETPGAPLPEGGPRQKVKV